jgi:hypothetical protein
MHNNNSAKNVIKFSHCGFDSLFKIFFLKNQQAFRVGCGKFRYALALVRKENGDTGCAVEAIFCCPTEISRHLEA